jgi:hypothetical protein
MAKILDLSLAESVDVAQENMDSVLPNLPKCLQGRDGLLNSRASLLPNPARQSPQKTLML